MGVRQAREMAKTKAGPAADDLLRLFKRTLRDLTPQQRRVLAGEIALVIPDESEATMQGRPDPLWIQSLRAFARRELKLKDPGPDSPPPRVGSAEAKALSGRLSEAIADMIDEVGQGQQVSLNKDEVARRLNYADRKGLEFAMNKCSLDWKPYQRLLRSPTTSA